MIYFISVNYYSSILISRLLQSIPLGLGTCQAVIVNNSPDDVLLHQLESSSVKIIEARSNLGFGCGCNLALRWIYERDPQAIVWIINPDAYLLKDPRRQLQHFFRTYPQLSIVGTIIKTFDGNVWFAGGRLEKATGTIQIEQTIDPWVAEYQTADWVSGCSLILNFKRFLECPQFNPNYFLYYEDVEFCQRYAKAGHLVAMMQQISIFHEPSSITNRNPFSKLKHSTYSYLITLEAFASRKAFFIRSLRLLLNSLYLLFIRPNAACGKLIGMAAYLRYCCDRSPRLPLSSRLPVRAKIHAD